MPSIQGSFYLLNAHASCTIFLHNRTQCIEGFSLFLERGVRKGSDAKNLTIFRFFFVTKRTQVKAVYA